MVKVKRNRCDWFKWLWFLTGFTSDYSMIASFSMAKKEGKVKSSNRIAYNVLKSNYSTTALAAMRFLGVPDGQM